MDRWNDGRKNGIAENKILEEIYQGLERDSLDIANDEYYFRIAVRGLTYFNDVVDGKAVQNDSLAMFYFFFAREKLVVQNKSGYESLKSRGLETITDDSLRSKIIDLYEVDYELARKFNEEHSDYKFTQNYFHRINDALAPHFEYDSVNNIQGIRLPINLEERERNLLKSYLWKIAISKQDRHSAPMNSKERTGRLRADIRRYLNEKSK